MIFRKSLVYKYRKIKNGRLDKACNNKLLKELSGMLLPLFCHSVKVVINEMRK